MPGFVCARGLLLHGRCVLIQALTAVDNAADNRCRCALAIATPCGVISPMIPVEPEIMSTISCRAVLGCPALKGG